MSLRLRGKERLKQTLEIFFRDAVTEIAYGNLRSPVIQTGANGDAALRASAAVHRIHRVEDEVQEHLLKLDAVTGNR